MMTRAPPYYRILWVNEEQIDVLGFQWAACRRCPRVHYDNAPTYISKHNIYANVLRQIYVYLSQDRLIATFRPAQKRGVVFSGSCPSVSL